MAHKALNFLCISTFFKGQDFIRYCKAEGNNVYLLTKKKLKNEAWPWEAIEETFYVKDYNEEDVINSIAYLLRTIRFDRLIALDDFDVEKVARLREHFRMPGMGETTARYFRDKLAMRIKAQESGIPVPAFTALFNDDAINSFIENIPSPWLLKPRMEASATGIVKIHNKDEAWQIVNEMGDDRHNYLIEKFAPGDVYHVDGLIVGGKVVFSRVSQYLDTPLNVAHGGGIFRSHTIKTGTEEEKALTKMNKAVMKAFGMHYGAFHTEFILSKASGDIFFLETSSRVGGAHLAEMVEAASGVNLWGEWARIESATLRNKAYQLPEIKNSFAGIVVSLSRFEHPDDSNFNDQEIVWRMHKPWHIGLIVESSSKKRVVELLNDYTKRIAEEFGAYLPPADKKPHV